MEEGTNCTIDTVDGQGPSTTGYLEMDERSAAENNVNEPEKRKNTGESRVILLNQIQPNKFCGNQISTAKYSLLSFLPKFLFEQFRRYANLFFLVIALLQQIPNVSPTGRYTTAVPLAIILIISAIKEIIEDFKRHRQDDATNNSTILAFRDRNFIEVLWKDLVVGDIVKVLNGHPFPADLVLLSSSEPHAMCYIETSNLDGETNLKLRQGLPQSAQFLTPNDLLRLGGHIECEQPNRHLYEFVGNFKPDGARDFPLGPDQLLLRGASLKNTQWVYGVIVYSGHETKVMLNSTTPPLKRSTVEIKTNFCILVLLGVLLFLTSFTSIANIIWTSVNKDGIWYLGYNLTGTPMSRLKDVLTNLILFNTIIPISLPVTLEVVRFIQAFLLGMDIDMYHEETDTPAMARTSNLNEELGQVKYVFSDKTGTLTRNIMEFRKCTIAGVNYGGDGMNDETSAERDLGKKVKKKDPDVDVFMTIMAVCHTVVPEVDPTTNEISYQASSPDENALVKAAKQIGYNFKTRTPEGVIIEVNGEERFYEILHVLEFTSDRKRMSVVVRMPDKSIQVMVKGADTVIYERLSPASMYKTETLDHLEDFARIGLRTLCLATATIPEAEYKKWQDEYHIASTAIANREKKVADVAEKIEKNLMLIGASAIEDKLQEGVPETIANLAKADIKIWVLTGDKQETAINIGYSCRLITQSMELLMICADTLDATREQLRTRVTEFGEELGKENEVALIVDGRTLQYALSCDCRREFLAIALSCKAVICCRVSPLQKAEMVQLVRTTETNAVTLAIGDGANDVGMIQAAHVGVGISGMEGLQAACSSDYAIAQFRFLNKLLLVHGAWNYHRLTKLILYSFYKNVCLYVIQFWFAILSGFSGQIVFERWTIGLYNVIFTAAPPLALGLFDRSCSAENCLKYPQLYKETQSSSSFNFKVFAYWVLNSIFHSAALFWLTVLALKSDIAFKDGKVGSLLFLGNMVYTYVVVTVCLKAGLEHTAWTGFSHLAIWGSIGAWFLFLIIYSHFFPTLPIAAEMLGMDSAVFSCGIFWFGLLLIPCAALTRDVAWKAMKRTLFHSVREQVMQMERLHEDPGHVFKDTKKKLTEKARLLKNVFTRSRSRSALAAANNIDQDRGYAFSQEEHGVVSQAQLIRSYNSTHRKPTGA